jgi:hypothetical protein
LAAKLVLSECEGTAPRKGHKVGLFGFGEFTAKLVLSECEGTGAAQKAQKGSVGRSGGTEMSGKHGHKRFEGHMHDYLAHIKAVEEDLEYYRAKRFEPRIFYLLRRNVLTFYDLLKVGAGLK